MAGEPSKRVHFFTLSLKTGRSVVRAETIDWITALADHAARDVADRMMKAPTGRLITEAVPECPSQVILGKVLDETNLGLHRGSIAGEFEVVAPRNADEFFLRVNYVQFIEGCNAFALIGGAGDVPSSSSVEVLAAELAPPGTGKRWIAEPIMSEPEFERFRQAKALKSLTTSVHVAPPDMFDPDAELTPVAPADLYSWGQAISADIGASVRISVKIALEEPSAHPDAARRLLSLLERSRDRLLPRARKVQALPVGDDEEIINLLRYKLTSSVALPDPVERVTGEEFQRHVLQQLQIVSASMKDQIVAATGG